MFLLGHETELPLPFADHSLRSKYQELLISDPPFAQALLRGFLRQISYECRELSRLAN